MALATIRAKPLAPNANPCAMRCHQAVQALRAERNECRPRWQRLFAAGAVLMAVMAASAEARAEFSDGNDLFDRCAEPYGSAGKTYCIAYINAITDALYEGAAIGGLRACFTEHVGAEQVEDIGERFLAAHPEKRHLGAAGLIAEALADVFPCTH